MMMHSPSFLRDTLLLLQSGGAADVAGKDVLFLREVMDATCSIFNATQERATHTYLSVLGTLQHSVCAAVEDEQTEKPQYTPYYHMLRHLVHVCLHASMIRVIQAQRTLASFDMGSCFDWLRQLMDIVSKGVTHFTSWFTPYRVVDGVQNGSVALGYGLSIDAQLYDIVSVTSNGGDAGGISHGLTPPPVNGHVELVSPIRSDDPKPYLQTLVHTTSTESTKGKSSELEALVQIVTAPIADVKSKRTAVADLER